MSISHLIETYGYLAVFLLVGPRAWVSRCPAGLAAIGSGTSPIGQEPAVRQPFRVSRLSNP